MTTIAINNFLPFPQETANLIIAEQLKNHVWHKFHYVLSEGDVEEILFTDMWPSIEEFIEYMTQDCVGIGEVIPGTINRKPPPTATLYSSAQLDAMDAGILPLYYGLRRADGIEMYLGSDDEDDRDYDDSILTEYGGEPLPLYDGDKLPVYSCPPPSPTHSSHLVDCLHLHDVIGPGDLVTQPKDPPGVTVVEETTNLKSRSKHNPLSLLHPRFANRVQGLKEKFPPRLKKPGRVKDSSEAARESFSKRVGKKLANLNVLDAMSPKRAVKRARRFVTLGRCRV
ncbi:hypothetical protein F5B21DRAFT_284673 [Xylaria acuta]|nr:hypothetical protein F5B21DRAFT_284673 [Xylaria acuta]